MSPVTSYGFIPAPAAALPCLCRGLFLAVSKCMPLADALTCLGWGGGKSAWVENPPYGSISTGSSSGGLMTKSAPTETKSIVWDIISTPKPTPSEMPSPHCK